MLGSPSQHPIGAVCGSAARTDLAGGRWATIVPTGTALFITCAMWGVGKLLDKLGFSHMSEGARHPSSGLMPESTATKCRQLHHVGGHDRTPPILTFLSALRELLPQEISPGSSWIIRQVAKRLVSERLIERWRLKLESV